MVIISVPAAVADLLRGRPAVGAHEQAFPFMTVDDQGLPHVALLSRFEIEPGPGDRHVLTAIASPRTRANLARDGKAGLIAIDDQSAHYLKLRVTHSLEDEGMLGCALEVVEHKEDSLGIPLAAMGFEATEYVGRVERWDRSERVLRAMAEKVGQQ